MRRVGGLALAVLLALALSVSVGGDEADAATANVPAALRREHAVFAATASLLRGSQHRGDAHVRVAVNEIAQRAALHAGQGLGWSAAAASQNTAAVLRKLVPRVVAFSTSVAREGGGRASARPLELGDLLYTTDEASSWRSACRCLAISPRGREWMLVCLEAFLTRIVADPTFANEWHGAPCSCSFASSSFFAARTALSPGAVLSTPLSFRSSGGGRGPTT